MCNSESDSSVDVDLTSAPRPNPHTKPPERAGSGYDSEDDLVFRNAEVSPLLTFEEAQKMELVYELYVTDLL